MQAIRHVVFALLIAVCGLVLAQERVSKPAAPAEATAQDDATATEGDPAPADGEDPAADSNDPPDTLSSPDDDAETASPTAPAATPRKPASATGSPQRFEPTEKVRPDFDVAFPVDI